MEAWQEIREAIATELADLLGQYTFVLATGVTTTPALHVAPPDLPQDRQVSGLEIVLIRKPTRWGQQSLSHHETALRRSYSLFLIQHDPNQTTEAAVTRLLALFPNTQISELPWSDRSPEQTRVEIEEFPKKLKRKF